MATGWPTGSSTPRALITFLSPRPSRFTHGQFQSRRRVGFSESWSGAEVGKLLVWQEVARFDILTYRHSDLGLVSLVQTFVAGILLQLGLSKHTNGCH